MASLGFERRAKDTERPLGCADTSLYELIKKAFQRLIPSMPLLEDCDGVYQQNEHRYITVLRENYRPFRF